MRKLHRSRILVAAGLGMLLLGAVEISALAAEPKTEPAPASVDDGDDLDLDLDAADLSAVETVDDSDLAVVETPTTDTGKPEPGFFQTLGRLHPSVVHFPIAWLTLLLLIELGAFLGRRDNWLEWGPTLIVLTALSFIPAAIAGFLRAGELPENQLVDGHRNLAIISFALTSAALALRLARRKTLRDEGLKWLYLGLITAATVLVYATGHRGGAMVFGEDFLPF